MSMSPRISFNIVHIVGLTLSLQVKLEDPADQDEFSIHPEPQYFWPRHFRRIKTDISPEPEQNIVEKKEV